MRVDLAYGRTGLTVELPDDRTTVVEPTYVPSLPDEAGAILASLRNPVGTLPLRRLVRSDQSVAISVCDITRPMPSATVLPVLLGELSHVPPDRIVVLIATGTHRENTPEELERMLGPEVTSRFRVVNHRAFDTAELTRTGSTSGGIPIWLNRHWVESEVRITTGFVEPHFFAGFSGGPKMVAPGLAGFDTIMRLHDADMIGHPNATWGVTRGNPIHDAIREIAARTGVDFSIDVTINRDRGITSVYSGELLQVHDASCDDAKRAAMRSVGSPFDVVITTNSGYPLDLNLYQAVKGMSAAAKVVRDGGAIICAAECSDGVPEHGEYRRMLTQRDSPEELLRDDPRAGPPAPRPVAGADTGADTATRRRLPQVDVPEPLGDKGGAPGAHRGHRENSPQPAGTQRLRRAGLRAPRRPADDPVPGERLNRGRDGMA